MISIDKKTSWGQVHLRILGTNETGLPENYSQTISALTGMDEKNIHILQQVHGDLVLDAVRVTAATEGDGLYTTEKNRALVIKTADCMPVFLWSEQRPLVAAIHSGWRGLENRIVERFCEKKFSPGEKISAYIGPCIGMRQYEVGEDVAGKLKDSFLEKMPQGKYLLGLRESQAAILEKIPALELEVAPQCTKLSEEFYSHRGGDNGRNLNLVWMD